MYLGSSPATFYPGVKKKFEFNRPHTCAHSKPSGTKPWPLNVMHTYSPMLCCRSGTTSPRRVPRPCMHAPRRVCQGSLPQRRRPQRSTRHTARCEQRRLYQQLPRIHVSSSSATSATRTLRRGFPASRRCGSAPRAPPAQPPPTRGGGTSRSNYTSRSRTHSSQ